jgi:hypothetical protein
MSDRVRAQCSPSPPKSKALHASCSCAAAPLCARALGTALHVCWGVEGWVDPETLSAGPQVEALDAEDDLAAFLRSWLCA